MPRKPEQAAAFEELGRAIEKVLRANADDPSIMDRYLPQEYIVVCAHAGLDPESRDPTTMTNIIFKDNDVPPHRAWGLVRWADKWLGRYDEEEGLSE